MLIRGNDGLGEVLEPFLLLTFMIADIMRKKGVAKAPPGTKSSTSPMIAGTHHFTSPCLVWDCFSGIRGLVRGFGVIRLTYSTIGACTRYALAPLSIIDSISNGLSLAIIAVTAPFLLTSSRKLTA